MKKYLIILIVLVIAAAIFLLNNRKVDFNRVELTKNNIVYNNTKESYLDTIVKVALELENLKGLTVVVKDLKVLKQNTVDGELDIKASIYGEGKLFILNMNNNINKEEAILVVAHEIIHLQQYYYGKLRMDGGQILWGGIPINYKNISYESRPWEMEAFEKQERLADRIKKVLL